MRDTVQAQNPKFVELAQKLTSRHPDITSREAEKMRDWELVWAEGPLDGLTDTAVYGLGVRQAHWEEVRPFVVDQARALGLNVTDDLYAQVFLADGTMLQSPRSAASQPRHATPREERARARDLEPIIYKRLKPFIEKHGYKAQRDRKFSSTFPNGWHIISVWVEEYRSDCQLHVGARSRFNPVTELIASIVAPEKSREEVKDWWTTILGQRKWMDGLAGHPEGYNKEYRITSHSQVDGILRHLEGKLEARFFPILEQYKSLEGFEALLNPSNVSSSVFFDTHGGGSPNIIAAFLARNPRLEAICNEFQSNARDPSNNGPLLRCIEYVRSRGTP